MKIIFVRKSPLKGLFLISDFFNFRYTLKALSTTTRVRKNEESLDITREHGS